VCEGALCAVFGRWPLVTDLAADDFDRLRRDFAKTRGSCPRHDMTRVRVLFNFGVDKKLGSAPRLPALIKKPTTQALRRDRTDKGKRTFEAAEIQATSLRHPAA